jgi:MFS family permease
MTHPSTKHELLDPNAGTARLPVVVPVALLSFFYMNALEYALPLYFGARDEAAKLAGGSFPADVWSEVVKYKVTAWIVGPLLAGLFARRYGERAVWAMALLGKVPIPFLLTRHPHENLIDILAVWQGFTGALMWIAGISLIQMVAPGKKGLSNGSMMVSMGVGSLLGPIGGRALLYRRELAGLVPGDWSELWSRLFNLSSMTTRPRLEDFEVLFWLLMLTTLICGVLIALWGQRPGRFERDQPPGWNQTVKDLGELSRTPKFWALVLALCLIGGPIFQASNQFLPYRAEDLGLKDGSQDAGWIWLTLLKTLMWIPGGAAVGLLAGRRAPGIAAVLMLAGFSLGALGIGESQVVWQLACCVALFEFVRQFMRWSHAGYMSEHLPSRLRATAIGFAITFSGLGSAIYAWVMPMLWNPQADDFPSYWPFRAAFLLGLVGTLGLLVYDRLHPIRDPNFNEDAAA